LGLNEGGEAKEALSGADRVLLPRPFGDYELLTEIARGGMGVVYKARQKTLDRIVAVKLILAGQFADKDSIQRFRTEASAAAALQHPNIVAIHEVGVHQGEHYLAMDFVEGPNLTKLISDSGFRNSDFKKAGRYVKIIAEAIHYAHERGILHRDLKPSNVLIDGHDQPRVTDFGLAKFVLPPSGGFLASEPAKAGTTNDLTLTGHVLGSPNYISPEQASGKRGATSRATDVYSLGAILYHLVTGRPPFLAESVAETLEQVLHSEPVSPRLWNPRIPADLETISLKCLEKEPARRYATAQELAEELGRFLNDEPLHARPVSRGEKLRRWCRRKPALAGALASALALLVVVAVGSPIAALRIKREQQRTQRNLVAQYVANGTRLMNDGDLFGSLLWYAEALRLDEGSPEREEPHRIRIASVLRQCPKLMNVFTHGTMLYAAQFSPDGKCLVTASDDRTARVWDVNAGQTLVTVRHGDEVFDAAFSPDGQRIVTSSEDGTARVWDAQTGTALTPPLRHGDTVWRACFSPDGKLVATASGDQTAQIWNATTGERIGSPFQHEDKVVRVAFSPDMRLLSAVTWGDEGSVWEIATGKRLFHGRHDSFQYTEVAFSPDSRRFLTVDGPSLRVWEASTGQECSFSPLKHRRSIASAVFSPNGRYVVTTADDNTTAVWDVATGQTVFSPAIQREDVNLQVAFSPDNRRVLTAGHDKIGRVWNARTGRAVCPPLKHILMVKRCAFNPDGRRLLTYSCDQAGRVWDLATSEAFHPFAPAGFDGFGIRSAARGGMLVRGPSNTVCITDATRSKVLTVLPHEFRVTYAAFSPDDQTVITACGRPNAVSSTRAAIFLWDTATGRCLNRTPMETAFELNCAAFSADGTRLVTGGLDFTARVWDARDGRPLTDSLRQGHEVMWVGFSPDGRSILTGCWDNTARVWDVATGRPTTAVLQHKARVCGAAWSADGRRLETLTRDGHRQTWDLATSDPLTPPQRVHSRNERPLPPTLSPALSGGEGAPRARDGEYLVSDNRPVDDLVLLARMLAVGRVDAGGNLVPLELNELRDAWATLRQKYPKQFAATPYEIACWHEREMEECEAGGDWDAALFHLERALVARPNDTVLAERRNELASALQNSAGLNPRQLGLARRIPSRDPRAQPQQVDLSAHYNLALGDSLIGKPDGEDLGPLPTGLQSIGNVLFDIRAVVHLSGQPIKDAEVDLPKHIEGIKLGRKCHRLHFLQATTDWVSHGIQVGAYVLHYANGEQRELPIIYGRDTGRSWGWPRLPGVRGEAVMAWIGSGQTSHSGNTQRVFKSTRDNPLPEVELVSIDFRSAMTQCAPFLIALTVE
jgi:WD40 repeat protein/predicted Ser/Thr protein kinase